MDVRLEAGEPETGLWCDLCLLPALVRIPIYVRGGCGQPIAVAVRCTTAGCGPQDHADSGPPIGA